MSDLTNLFSKAGEDKEPELEERFKKFPILNVKLYNLKDYLESNKSEVQNLLTVLSDYEKKDLFTGLYVSFELTTESYPTYEKTLLDYIRFDSTLLYMGLMKKIHKVRFEYSSLNNLVLAMTDALLRLDINDSQTNNLYVNYLNAYLNNSRPISDTDYSKDFGYNEFEYFDKVLTKMFDIPKGVLGCYKENNVKDINSKLDTFIDTCNEVKYVETEIDNTDREGCSSLYKDKVALRYKLFKCCNQGIIDETSLVKFINEN